MKIDENSLLFFDASCLIAAAGSPSGGSGFLLSLCARGFLKGVISQPVLLEAQRNVQSKLGQNALDRFYRLIFVIPFALAPLPPKDRLQDLEKLVNAKDFHVIAAATEVNAPFLITLDKGFALEVNKANLKITALAPEEFIKTVLPTHVDYPSARD